MLKRGSSGAEVEDLQRKLLANKINPGPVDGLFGPKTEDAVRRFQEMHDLQVDGIVGPETNGAFEAAAAKASSSLSQAKDAMAASDARAKAAQERADAARRASQQQASSQATSEEADAKKSVDKAGGIFSRIFKRGTDK